MALKIKIKKNTLVRKIDGVKKTGFYGKVIANGTKSFEDIVKQSTHGSTLDYREAETDENTVSDDDRSDSPLATEGTQEPQTGGNGGDNNPPSGELEG